MNFNPSGQALNRSHSVPVRANDNLARPAGRVTKSDYKTALLILGMHRSGTSSVSGTMVRLGGTAPFHLMPPTDANPAGYWESTVLVALNDQVLAAADGHWQDWRPFDLTRVDPARVFALKQQAKSTLAAEFGNASLAVIKDPRMCRLMPFWSPVFQEANWTVRPILQLRSPLEVALSLNRRDGTPLGVGCLIWLRHVLDAEAATRGMRRAVIEWNDFLRDRRGALERVGEQLRVVWPRCSKDALAEIDLFVSADLRHQRASDNDLQVHPAINHLVREAYDAARQLVENPASEKVERTLADIRARFDAAAAIFGHAMFEQEEETRRAQSMTAAAREELARQQSETSRQLTAVQSEASRQLAEAREEASRQLAATRDDFAARLNEAQSECRRVADQANRIVARAEDIIAHLSFRSEPRSASVPKRRFWDHFPARRERRKELTAIRNSAFFDAEFYLNSNPDVRAAGIEAAFHYLVSGGSEGRDPGPFFSTHEYLMRFPDVAAAGANALVHYEMCGRREMRKIPVSRAGIEASTHLLSGM